MWRYGVVLILAGWFSIAGGFAQSVTLDSTNLPLVVIDTEGKEIPDEPKVNVQMKIIHNRDGTYNHPSDPGNEYDGIVGIEIRGAYSSSLPQKPYGFETRQSNGENLNISLLDMPEENDWILLANYNDKVFMRNILAFHLFEKMGHYAPRTHLCEVILNGEYKGIYVLTEKIKRDKNRINIAKLDADDLAGDSLTGGYIFKVDYPENGYWVSAYENPDYPGKPVYYIPAYPKVREIHTGQRDYLIQTVATFEDALWGADFRDQDMGYRKYIDVESFIDYFLISELSRNTDGYKKSRYLYKDKDSKDPLIHAGPVWDFDWAFKDETGMGVTNGEGWRYSYTGPTDMKPPGWYIRLLEDPWFAGRLNDRFTELQGSIFDLIYLNDYIDSVAAYVDEAQQRHYERWPILGINVGTPEIGTQPTTYKGEVDKFKRWVIHRLLWLGDNMPEGDPSMIAEKLWGSAPGFRYYPNPSTDRLTVESSRQIREIRIFDLQGKVVMQVRSSDARMVHMDVAILQGPFVLEVQYLNGVSESELFITY